MVWNSSLTGFRDILAQLFPAREEVRALLDEAGISKQRIVFLGSAEVMWHGILDEVAKQQRLPDLLSAARAKYPHIPEFAVAHGSAVKLNLPTPHPATGVDLAILTAMPEELSPVLDLIGGRDRWREESINGFVQYRASWQCSNTELEVLAMHTEGYGGDLAAVAVGRLSHMRPRLLAMVGICAGRVGDEIRLGHVLVADRAFKPDEGKKTGQGFQPDTTTHSPPGWLLQQLRGHEQFRHEWVAAITRPHPAGRETETRSHVVAFASGDEILAVANPFAKARKQVRKTGAYELEVKSFLAAAHSCSIPAFAVKGVCDAGTPEKDDAYHEYAAEAAARWLHSFVNITLKWP